MRLDFASRVHKDLQLYLNKDRAASEAIIRNIESQGFKAIMLTVDAAVPGKRELDQRTKGGDLKVHPDLLSHLPFASSKRHFEGYACRVWQVKHGRWPGCFARGYSYQVRLGHPDLLFICRLFLDTRIPMFVVSIHSSYQPSFWAKSPLV